MKTSKRLSLSTLALWLAGSVIPALAKDPTPLLTPSSETTLGGSVACGALQCTDTYRFRCPAKSRIATAIVTDNDGLGDNISITLLAVTPVSLQGKSEQGFTPANGPGSGKGVSLTRPTAGAMDLYVMVSNFTNIQVAYLLDLICLDDNLDFLTPIITFLQDE